MLPRCDPFDETSLLGEDSTIVHGVHDEENTKADAAPLRFMMRFRRFQVTFTLVDCVPIVSVSSVGE